MEEALNSMALQPPWSAVLAGLYAGNEVVECALAWLSRWRFKHHFFDGVDLTLAEPERLADRVPKLSAESFWAWRLLRAAAGGAQRFATSLRDRFAYRGRGSDGQV